MEPVRIAVIAGKMHGGGGVESTLMSYVRAVDKNAVRMTLLIDGDSRLIPREELHRYGVEYLIIPPYQKPIRYQRFLYRLFREQRFDAVHAHINTMSVFPLFAAWRAHIPVRIVQNHSTAGRGEYLKNIMKYTLRPFAKTFATHRCACSRYAGNWLFGNTAFSVLPNQIDFNYAEYAFLNSLRIKTREEMGIKEAFVVGLVGRFVRQKNHAFALAILQELQKRRPEAKLLFVGEGPLLEEIRKKASQMGLQNAVIFAGLQQEMRRMYCAMDVLLMPSLYEGYPLALQEAVMSGLKAVCSTNVPRETEKAPGAITFVSLNAPLSEWAERVLEYAADGRMAHAPEALGYDAGKTAEALTAWYQALKKDAS